MALPIMGLVSALVGPVTDIIDDLHTSDEEKAKMKAKLMEQASQQKLAEAAQQMSAILAEAQSPDPWTSRARPSFFYVMYTYLISAIPFGICAVFWPDNVTQATVGIQGFLAAIPEEMWWLFGTGFLGYTGARSVEKMKGAAK